MLKDINAVEAHSLIDKNAVLVDVREPYEIAAERIPGSIELPLSQLARGMPANLPQDRAIVFHCASGARTKSNGTGAGLADQRQRLQSGRRHLRLEARRLPDHPRLTPITSSQHKAARRTSRSRGAPFTS